MTTEQQLRQQIIEKAWEDDNFKQELLANPKDAIKKEFGVEVPDGIELHVYEESYTEFHLVIPPNPADSGDDDGSDNAAW